MLKVFLYLPFQFNEELIRIFFAQGAEVTVAATPNQCRELESKLEDLQNPRTLPSIREKRITYFCVPSLISQRTDIAGLLAENYYDVLIMAPSLDAVSLPRQLQFWQRTDALTQRQSLINFFRNFLGAMKENSRVVVGMSYLSDDVPKEQLWSVLEPYHYRLLHRLVEEPQFQEKNIKCLPAALVRCSDQSNSYFFDDVVHKALTPMQPLTLSNIEITH